MEQNEIKELCYSVIKNLNNEEIYHHGVPGMKWGQRLYQNKDGSLTALGRKRAAKLENKYKYVTGRNIKKELQRKEESRPKELHEMTNEELQRKTTRLNTEKNYLEAVKNRAAVEPKQVSRGKAFIKASWNDMIRPAATNAGKDFLEKAMKNFGNDILVKEPSEYEKLKREANKMQLERQKLQDEETITQIKKRLSQNK